MFSNGNSFNNGASCSAGDSMNTSLGAATYPEPWFIRMLGPVAPGAALP